MAMNTVRQRPKLSPKPSTLWTTKRKFSTIAIFASARMQMDMCSEFHFFLFPILEKSLTTITMLSHRIVRTNNKGTLLFNGSKGSVSFTTPQVYCTASLGNSSHLFVKYVLSYKIVTYGIRHTSCVCFIYYVSIISDGAIVVCISMVQHFVFAMLDTRPDSIIIISSKFSINYVTMYWLTTFTYYSSIDIFSCIDVNNSRERKRDRER